MTTPSPPLGVERPRRLLVISVVSGVVAMLISVAGSWVPSLWGDEAASQLSARRSLSSLGGMLLNIDAVHGTYYAFLHFWVKLFGYSAFSIRFPSALAVGLCVGLVVWLCARLSTMRVAVLAGLVCAVLPRLTYAGEEARAFSFDAAFAAALCVLVVEVSRRPGRRRALWVVYGAVLALATYFFMYTSLVTLALGAFILLTPALRNLWKGWLIASAAALSAAAPLFVIAFLERHQISYLQTADYASWDVIFKQMWFGDQTFAWVGWVLIAIAIAVSVWRLSHSPAARRGPDLAVLALCWTVVPTALLLVANSFFALFTARYAAFTAPAAGILIALGVDGTARLVARRAREARVATAVTVVLALGVVTAAAPNWASQRGPYSQNESDWNQIAATVRAHARSGDAVVFDASASPSRRTRLAYDTAPPGSFGQVHDVLLRTPYGRSSRWDATTYSVQQAAALGRFTGVTRIWLVEYKTPPALVGRRQPDTYGIAALQHLGYSEATSYTLHASVVRLFTRNTP